MHGHAPEGRRRAAHGNRVSAAAVSKALLWRWGVIRCRGCDSLQMHGELLECSLAGLAAEFVESVHLLVASVCRQSSIALRCVELHTQGRDRSIGYKRSAMCRADGDEACEL